MRLLANRLSRSFRDRDGIRRSHRSRHDGLPRCEPPRRMRARRWLRACRSAPRDQGRRLRTGSVRGGLFGGRRSSGRRGSRECRPTLGHTAPQRGRGPSLESRRREGARRGFGGKNSARCGPAGKNDDGVGRGLRTHDRARCGTGRDEGTGCSPRGQERARYGSRLCVNALGIWRRRAAGDAASNRSL